MPVSDETQEQLNAVKNGKPRRFVMLTKGANIVSLVLFKSGAPAKYLKQAKEDGRGIPCYGAVIGKGVDITFQLAIDDGFDTKPVKDAVLKKYLEEEADFRCKPLIEIVQSRSLALDPEDPLHARFLKLQAAALKACDDFPERAPDVETMVRRIGVLIDDDEREKAAHELDVFTKLLKELAASEIVGAGGSKPDPHQVSYRALRNKLEPMLLAVLKSRPENATALGNVWNYSAAQASAGNYEAANKALAGLADALKKAAAKSAGDSRGGLSNVGLSTARRQWEETRKAVLAELEGLEAAIIRSFAALPRFPQDRLERLAAGTSQLYTILDSLDARLLDVLEDALSTTDTDTRANHQTEAKKLIDRYRKFANSSALVRAVDNNPFKKIDVRGRVESALDVIGSQLE